MLLCTLTSLYLWSFVFPSNNIYEKEMPMKVRKFTRAEDARYARMVSSARGSNRAVLAKRIGEEIVFSDPLITLVPRLLAKGWQQVRPSKRGHRRLRHALRIIK